MHVNLRGLRIHLNVVFIEKIYYQQKEVKKKRKMQGKIVSKISVSSCLKLMFIQCFLYIMHF